MSKRARRSMMGAFAAATGVVLLASIAWACTPDHTNAHPWFCKHNVQRCAYSQRIGLTGTPASASRSYYSMLGGAPLASDVVSANTNYTLRWTTGNHQNTTDMTCKQTTTSAAFKKTNGADATFTTGTTGSWGGQGPVSMPRAGTYTICAMPDLVTFPDAGGGGHYYPFVVV